MKPLNNNPLFAKFLTNKESYLIVDGTFKLSHIDNKNNSDHYISVKRLNGESATMLTPYYAGKVFCESVEIFDFDCMKPYKVALNKTFVCVAINQCSLNKVSAEFYPNESDIAKIGETFICPLNSFNDETYRYGIWMPIEF